MSWAQTSCLPPAQPSPAAPRSLRAEGRRRTRWAPAPAPPPAPPALPPWKHLARARRGGSVPRGPGPWRWSSSCARAVGYSPGGRRGRSTRVAPRAERCGDAGCADSCPRDASLVPGELLPAAPRGTEGGGSESRPRPGQWQSAELAALPLLFLRPEARSSGGWVGAKGRGRGRGGGRRPGGAFEGAGFGCAGPDTPSAYRAKGSDQRGREREESGLGRW